MREPCGREGAAQDQDHRHDCSLLHQSDLRDVDCRAGHRSTLHPGRAAWNAITRMSVTFVRFTLTLSSFFALASVNKPVSVSAVEFRISRLRFGMAARSFMPVSVTPDRTS